MVNVHILNSLVILFSNALKPELVEQKILPLYSKHRIDHDMYTFQHLAKLQLNIRELDKVVELYRKTPQVNKMILGSFMEAGLRKEDSDIVCEALEKFVEIGHEPHPRVLKRLSSIKKMPDRMYVLLKKHFPDYGLMKLKVRQFDKPTDRPEASGMPFRTFD